MAPDSSDDDHTDEDTNHDESQESSRDDHPGFFDLEASEASSQFGSEGSLGSDDTTVPSLFPTFLKLPLEIRELIWKSFCPDLDNAPRIFELGLCSHLSGVTFLRFGPHAERQTLPIRTVMAVHRESRALGLKFSPHRLELPDDRGFVPCNMNRDVILFGWKLTMGGPVVSDAFSLLAQVALGAQHVAFHINILYADLEDESFASGSVLPSLRNVFMLGDAEDFPVKALTWCVSDHIHEYRIEVEEEEPALGEDFQMTYCWPDPEKYVESERHEIFERRLGEIKLGEDGYTLQDGSLEDHLDTRTVLWAGILADTRRELNSRPLSNGTSLESSPTSCSSKSQDASEDKGGATERRHVRVWPMTCFMFNSGIQFLEDMRTWQQPWTEWESECDSLVSQDEYESDGIDDDPVDESLATDDEDDLPAHLLGGSSQASDLPLDHNDLAPALFSSDSEVADTEDHDQDGSQSHDEKKLRSRATRPKRRVIESDSDDQSATETGSVRASAHRTHIVQDNSDENEDKDEDTAPKPARGATRRTRPVAVDSEDEDESAEEAPRREKRARTGAISVDSDDDADEDDPPPQSRPTGRRAHAAVPSGSEDDDSSSSEEPEDEDSSDQEPPPAKRVSLAKRLRMEYRQSRNPRHADADSDEEAGGSDSYGGASDDENDEEEDESDGDGMVMRMAEEGEDGEEEDEGSW